jgi:hypothetical protein
LIKRKQLNRLKKTSLFKVAFKSLGVESCIFKLLTMAESRTFLKRSKTEKDITENIRVHDI